MKIQSDNSCAKNILEKIAQEIKREGGFLHPDIEIICRNNSLSIHSVLNNNYTGQILNVPEQCLPSCLDFNIVQRGNTLNIVGTNTQVSKSHDQFMNWMIELFNELKGGEIAQIDGFARALREDNPDLFNLINTVQPLTKNIDGNCHSFLQTRTINFTNHLDQLRQKVLMPIIDSINHNSRAQPFKNGTDYASTGISIAHAKPIEDNSECFVSYGMLDAFNTATGMNFFDAETHFVQSIPLTLQITDEKTIKLYRNYYPANPDHIHPYLKDLGLYVPITSDPKDAEIKLSHLFIPGRDKPRSMRRILEVIILQSSPDPIQLTKSFVEELIAKLESQIIEKNTDYFQTILNECSKHPNENISIIAAACRRSIDLIADYRIFSKQYPLTLINY